MISGIGGKSKDNAEIPGWMKWLKAIGYASCAPDFPWISQLIGTIDNGSEHQEETHRSLNLYSNRNNNCMLEREFNVPYSKDNKIRDGP